ncbi:two-partner secretion domain-containing protein [Falsiroseomonas bella]|uniref:two-partner secretion domain-containing protein n=1 Tax=Falsiroseomonas bella TaxID=2184016 RepID=UPI001304F6E4|nr:filamentous hemagglutinin N-terminal domain-containing protein [Falsiroseomonas bella]
MRLRRRALLASTALQAGFAIGFAIPAAAQPAPNAGPQGGAVVAGQASIARQGNATTITQSTDRAAIDWRTFDVGRDHTVRFQQPGASSMTLNRVTTPRPSEIAGRIQANGGVVVINGAGVLFHRGAQVEAQSFVASTADTTNAAFMAGRLRFDRPGQPGARVENRGEITVREAGLAALVAPGVANSGTIRARLGTVVLAGAETHTLDLHGDGLVAFDVTGQVRTAPRGADGQPAQALVTNTGVVVAEGGTVLMTARAADGVVQQLVSAGGTIRADSSGSRTGSIEIAGVGGGIRIHGTVAAEGARPGERGGTVVARASGDVELAPSARVSASGVAGGGTVAIGTTAARARAQGGGVPADAAARVRVAEGAEVRADATQAGNGGRIAFIGRQAVAMAGKVSARGGPKGGDGGQVEVSADRGLAITGGVDALAPAGKAGTLLLDPLNLHIVGAIPDPPNVEQPTSPTSPQVGAGDAAPGGGDDGYLLASTVTALLGGGNVRLEAGNDLTVSEAFGFSANANSLTLAAGNSVVVNQAITLQGDVILLASDPAIPGATATGQVQVNAAIASTAGSVLLRAFGDAGQVAFGPGGTAQAAERVTLVANGMALPSAAGAIQAPAVEISPNAGRALSFGAGAASGLALPDLAGVQAGTLRLGAATLSGGAPTTLAGSARLAGALSLSGVDLDLRATGAVTQDAALGLSGGMLRAEAGSIRLDNASNAIASLGPLTATAGDLTLVTAGALTAQDAIGATGTATLRAGGTLTLGAGGSIGGAAVSLRAGAGGMALAGGIATPGTLELATTGAVGGDGVISAGLLAGAVGSLSLGGTTPAAIAAIGDLTVRGAFDLRAAGPLAVTGGLRAALLTDGALRLELASGALTADGVIATGTAGVTGGEIALVAPGGVTLSGTVRARSSAGSDGDISIAASGGVIRQTAGSVVAARNLTLAGAEGIVQAGGTLDALRLDAATSAAGAAIELGGANRLDALGSVSAAGSLGVNNAIALALAGPVRAGQAPAGAPDGTLAELRIAAEGAIAVTGTIAAGQAGGGGAPAVAGIVLLQSSDGAQRSGAASAAAIDVAPGAAITAERSGGRGGEVTLGATSTLPGGGAVTIRAPLAVPMGGGIAVTANAVTIGGGAGAGAGALVAPSGHIALTTDALVLEGMPAAGANLVASGGTITIAQRSAAVGVSLGGAAPGLALDADALTRIVGDTLQVGRADGGAVTINGAAALPSVETLRLLSGGDLSATVGGTLQVNRLTAAIGGTIALDTPGGPHQVGTIGALSAGGSLAFRGQGDLVVDGAVQGGPSVALATGPGGSLTLQGGGSVTAAAAGVLTLQADQVALGGPVSTPGGHIEILPATSGRTMTLGGTGGLSLQQGDLDRLSAATLLLGGREADTAQAGDLSVAAAVDLSGRVDRLRLRLQGVAADAGGGTGIRVGRLGNTAAGSAPDVAGLSLLGTGNAIGAVDAFRSGGGFALQSAVPLSLIGPIEAAGALAVTGTGTGANALRVTGSIASGTSGGAASGTAGPLTLETTQGGLVVAGGSVLRSRNGGLTIHGASSGTGGLTTIAAGANVSSASQATIRGDAGLFIAGTVSGPGGVQLRATAPGTGPAFTLAATGSVTSPAGDIGLSIGGIGSATLDGTLAATNGRLVLDGGVVSGRGPVRVETVTGSARALSLTGTANRIGALEALGTSTGGITVSSLDPLTVRGVVQAAGPVTLSAAALTVASGALLSAPGSAMSLTANTIQADGRVEAASLTGRATGGPARFAHAANAVATLGDFSAGTSFLYRGAAALTVAGTVVAPAGVTIATTAAGADALRLSGSATAASGPVSLEVPNGRLRLTGNATAGTAMTLLAGQLSQEAGLARGASLQATIGGAATQAAGATLRSTATDAALTAASFDLAGTLDAARDLRLTATGGDGVLSATTTAGQDAIIAVTGGGFALSGALAAGRDVSATASGDVGVAAALTAGTGTATLVATSGALTLSNDVTAASAVTLQAGAGIAQALGTVQGASVEATAGGAATQAAGATMVATATDIAVTAASFDLAGTLDAARDLRLTATGGDGVLSATTTAGQDAIIAVTGGGFALSGTLAVGRDVSATASGDVGVAAALTAGTGTATLVATSGALTLSNDVTAAGAVTLQAGAGIAQTVGTVQGASIEATAGAAATQAGGATLRSTATDIAITAVSFDLAGTLDAARDVMLTATSGGARLAGIVTADRSIAVEAADGIVQTGSMDAGWTMSLTAQDGDIEIAGSLATGGSPFHLLDIAATRGSIRLTGDIDAGFNAAVMTAGTDIVQSAGSVVGHSVSLKADGAVTQTAGLLHATGVASPASTFLGIEAARFDLAGTLEAASGISAVALSGPGVISGTVTAGGNLSADAVAGTLTLSGTLSSLNQGIFAGAAGITQSGSVTAVDSLSFVATSGSVTIGGTVRSGDVFLGAGGDIRVTGEVRASGELSLQAAGAIEAPGLLVADRLFGSAGGGATMTGDNLIAELGGFRAGGDLTLRNAQPLTVLGAATAGGTIGIETRGALTFATIFGDVALDAPAIRLDAGAILQSSGILRTGALDARATGDILLALPTNRIPLLTARAGGDLTLVTETALTLNGPVTAGGALSLTASDTITVPAGIQASAGTTMTLSGAALDLSGEISAQDLGFDATSGDIAQRAGSIAWTGTAAMNAPGALSQSGGALLGGPDALLTGSAGGAIDLAAGGNRLPRLGPLDAGQQITVASLGDTTVVGALAAAGGPLTLATEGSLTIQPVSLTATAATLTAGGDIAQQAGGSLAVPGAVAVTATGNAALDGSVTGATITVTTGLATSQQASGSMIATGPLTVTAGTDIALDGVVIGNPVTLNAGRNLSQAVTGRLTTTTLTLGIGGDAGFAGGITADLLTGTIGGALLADGPEMRIGLLRDIAAGRSLILVNDQALQVEGSIAAPSLIVYAAGPLTIGNVALNTSGVPYVEPPPGPLAISRLPEPIPGTPGAVFGTGAPRLDVGTLTVTPLGTPNATLALRLPESGGALTISDILQAPTTDVTFDLGTGGNATGRINVRNLTVLGVGGTAVLEGTVRGLEGTAAASVSVIGPQVEPDYQINECPVGAVNCVLLIVQIPVVTDPLKELGVTTTPDDQDDMDIYVPNVAERDF